MDVIRRELPDSCKSKLPGEGEEHSVGANEALLILAEAKDPPPPPLPEPVHISPPDEEKEPSPEETPSDSHEESMKSHVRDKVSRISVRVLMCNQMGSTLMDLNDAVFKSLPRSAGEGGEVKTAHVKIGQHLHNAFFRRLLQSVSGPLSNRLNNANTFGITSRENLRRLVDPGSWEAKFDGKDEAIVRVQVSNKHPVHAQLNRSGYKLRFHFWVQVYEVHEGQTVKSLDVF